MYTENEGSEWETGDRERSGSYGDSLWRQPCSSRTSRDPLNARPDLTTARRRPGRRRPSKIRRRGRRRSVRATISGGGWFAPGLAWVHRRCGRFHACPPVVAGRSPSFIRFRPRVRPSLIASLGNFRSAYVRLTYVQWLRLSECLFEHHFRKK